MENIIKTIVVACLSVLCMTSCLKDDDDNVNNTIYQLTATDKSVIMNDLVASYEGKVLYFKNSFNKDSIYARCEVRQDSVAQVYVPVSIFANYLPMAAAATKEVLQNCSGLAVIPFKVQLPYTTYTATWTEYWQKGFYESMFIPTRDEFKFITEEHEFVLNFITNNYANYGGVKYYPVFSYYQSNFQAYIIIESLTYDGNKVALGMPILFYGKKI